MLRQQKLSSVERREELPVSSFIGLLCGGKASLVRTIGNVIVHPAIDIIKLMQLLRALRHQVWGIGTMQFLYK